MRHCISAQTAPGCSYPSYVSVNVDGDTGEIEFTVRSEPKPDGACGETACAKVSAKDFSTMAREMFSFACTSSA